MLVVTQTISLQCEGDEDLLASDKCHSDWFTNFFLFKLTVQVISGDNIKTFDNTSFTISITFAELNFNYLHINLID